MAAALILMVGVLGVATLSDVANQMTSRADGRSGATNISRRVAEAARSLTTTQLTTASLIESLKGAAPSLPDSTPADEAWTVTHRGAVYTIDATVCTVDEAADGYAAPSSRDTSYCVQPGPAATTPPDSQPDDYRRVRVTVASQRRPAESVRSFTNVSSGTTSNLPLITNLRMRQGAGSCTTNCSQITTGTQSDVVFDATTANNPASVGWLIDGRAAASCPPTTVACSGAGNAWTFTWNIKPVVNDTQYPNAGTCLDPAGLAAGSKYQLDGVYQVGVQGFDRSLAGGGAASMTIVLNRCVALPPPGFDATGRETTGSPVIPIDIGWRDNREGDVIGYRVYRGTSNETRQPVCPANITTGAYIPFTAANECVDTSPPAYSTTAFYYGVYAIDRHPTTGALREGAVSFINVNSGNRAPFPVSNLAATRVSGKVKLTWTIPTAGNQDPDNKVDGDVYESFRIYRRSGTNVSTNPSINDRYDREAVATVCTGTTCTWTDTASPTSTTAYWVRSVDMDLRESAFPTGASGVSG